MALDAAIAEKEGANACQWFFGRRFGVLCIFSSNFPFLELDYLLSGEKCRYRHFSLAA
jgi:hypothetical protein